MTATVMKMISSFRRQNTRKRSLKVKCPSLGRPRGSARVSGESKNTLRAVALHPRLLLAAQPLDGGVAKYVVSLARALPPGRFTVDVACPRGSLTWSSLEGAPGVELHPIGAHRRPAPGDARSLLALLRLAGRADIVHVHSSKAGFLGRLASRARGKGRAPGL